MSVGAGLDIFHIVVGEAEMVADLMDQDMPDDITQVFAGLAPIVENRPPVEEDPVEVGRTGQYSGFSERNTRIKAENPERIFGAKFVQNVLFGEVGDHKCNVACMDAQDFRDCPERIPREGADIVDARWFKRLLHTFAINAARFFR